MWMWIFFFEYESWNKDYLKWKLILIDDIVENILN